MKSKKNMNTEATKKPWCSLSQKELEAAKKNLTSESYIITQEDGTEQPFTNPYWNLKDDGIYIDIVSGEPLFSSTDKFDSGTGWPSFHKPIHNELIVEQVDHKLGIERIEVRSKHANSHLGHVFSDGPSTTGLRYCINSASLKFIPKENLINTEYEQYLDLFDN